MYFYGSADQDTEDFQRRIQNRIAVWKDAQTTDSWSLLLRSSFDWKPADDLETDALFFLSPQQQLEDVVMTFSLNVSQMAEVMRVSRQTIYDWRDGPELRPEHRERLNQLHGLVLQYRELDPIPIGEALTWVGASTGQSLFDLLRAEDLDLPAIRNVLTAMPARIEDQFAEANAEIARIEKEGWPEIPENWRNETLRRSSGRNVRSHPESDF